MTVPSADGRADDGPRMTTVSEGSAIVGSSTMQPCDLRISSALVPTRKRCWRLGIEMLSVVVVEF
jgi:hypothetical protein